ncbi:plantaricin C family lantibiotic [Romboutsia lituseburensis]|uniref:plantaricin C family lantibiotic n=1 Tax=Romboutsia lituseburensis TaxID=1537 RepID=UPI0022EB93AB|nr:plantaricin C family lantibiotic [Romboutsia lituseburensis]
MNFSKRNPLLRKNVEEFNNLIGSLGQEIEEQNLEDIAGGSSQICASIEVATLISAGVTWANDKYTAYAKCGGVWSATAECFCK